MFLLRYFLSDLLCIMKRDGTLPILDDLEMVQVAPSHINIMLDICSQHIHLYLLPLPNSIWANFYDRSYLLQILQVHDHKIL